MKEVTKVGLLEIIDMMAKAEPYISVTVQVYMMLDEIRVHNFPDEEEEEQAISLAKQYALLVTENGLEECIMKNRDTSERAGSGLPSACEEIAGALKAFGGKENVARMTTNYNKYRK